MQKKKLLVLISLILLLLISGIVFIYLNLKDEHPIFLKKLDTNKLNSQDEPYYRNADLFVYSKWNPKDYIEIDKTINLPIYDITAGSIVKDQWTLDDNNYLYLECNKIEAQYLSVPPYRPYCTLNFNSLLLSNYVGSDVVCPDYEDATNCKQIINIILYEDSSLANKYLFVGSTDSGSAISVSGYEIKQNEYSQLFFDSNDSILENVLTRMGMDIYLVYTNSTDKDFKLVTHFSDPSMVSIKGIYNEWQVTNGRFLLVKKIVEI